jgi:hypothetical protein
MYQYGDAKIGAFVSKMQGMWGKKMGGRLRGGWDTDDADPFGAQIERDKINKEHRTRNIQHPTEALRLLS